MRQEPHSLQRNDGLESGIITIPFHKGAYPTSRPPQPAYARYSDQPMDWRTRLVGLGGTASVGLVITLCLFVTWHVVQPVVSAPAITLVRLQSHEASQEPFVEVPEGARQVQQDAHKSTEQDRPDPPAEIIMPALPALMPTASSPDQPTIARDPVPETSAPKSLPAPLVDHVSSNADATWQALLLAHLEKYRRYPARARAARKQGVVYVSFRMNRDGIILSSSIHHGSGSYDLDRAALATLDRAQPLPRIPDDKPDIVELTLPVEFFTR